MAGFPIRDPETGDLLELDYQPGSKAELQELIAAARQKKAVEVGALPQTLTQRMQAQPSYLDALKFGASAAMDPVAAATGNPEWSKQVVTGLVGEPGAAPGPDASFLSRVGSVARRGARTLAEKALPIASSPLTAAFGVPGVAESIAGKVGAGAMGVMGAKGGGEALGHAMALVKDQGVAPDDPRVVDLLVSGGVDLTAALPMLMHARTGLADVADLPSVRGAMERVGPSVERGARGMGWQPDPLSASFMAERGGPPKKVTGSTVPDVEELGVKPEEPTIELRGDEGIGINASGESAVSAEAMSRLKDMKARGEQFGVFDQAGRFRPTIGAESVDFQPQRGQIFGKATPHGFEELSRHDVPGRVNLTDPAYLEHTKGFGAEPPPAPPEAKPEAFGEHTIEDVGDLSNPEDFLASLGIERPKGPGPTELAAPEGASAGPTSVEPEPTSTRKLLRSGEDIERQNSPGPLGETVSGPVYRETDIEGAHDFLGGTIRNMTQDDVYLATSPDLALGQGTNKGVMIELDPTQLSGHVDRSKPMWKALADSGEAEFVTKLNDQKTYQDSVRSVTIRPDAVGAGPSASRMKYQLSDLEKQGWTKATNSDGSITYRRPATPEGEPVQGVQPPPVEAIPQPAPPLPAERQPGPMNGIIEGGAAPVPAEAAAPTPHVVNEPPRSAPDASLGELNNEAIQIKRTLVDPDLTPDQITSMTARMDDLQTQIKARQPQSTVSNEIEKAFNDMEAREAAEEAAAAEAEGKQPGHDMSEYEGEIAAEAEAGPPPEAGKVTPITEEAKPPALPKKQSYADFLKEKFGEKETSPKERRAAREEWTQRRRDAQIVEAAKKAGIPPEKIQELLKEPREEVPSTGILSRWRRATLPVIDNLGKVSPWLKDKFTQYTRDAEVPAMENIAEVYKMKRDLKISPAMERQIVDIVEGKTVMDPSTPPALRTAAIKVKGMLDKAWQDAIDSGVVKESDRPRANYFPHRFAEGWDDPIVQGTSLRKGKGPKDPHLEKARLSKRQDYRRDLNSLDEYFLGVYKRISEVKHFGKGQKVINDWLEARDFDPETLEWTKTNINRMLGNEPTSLFSRGAAKYRALQAIRDLGFSAFYQPLQGINTVLHGGIGRSAQALKLLASSESRAAEMYDAIRSGALAPDITQELIAGSRGGGDLPGGGLTKFLSKEMYGTRRIDQFTRVHANTVGKMIVRDALKGNRGALRDIRALGFEEAKDLASLQKAMADNPKLNLQVGKALSDKALFRAGAAEVPGWASSTTGKLATQYTRFMYRHSMFVKDIFGQASKGNVAPLARFLAVGFPLIQGGAEVLYPIREGLKNVIRQGVGTGEVDPDQLKEAMFGKEEGDEDEWKKLLSNKRISMSNPGMRLLQNLSMWGGIGIFQIMAERAASATSVTGSPFEAGAKLVTGPLPSNVMEAAGGAMMDVGDLPEDIENEEIPFKRTRRKAIEQVPIFGRPIAQRMREALEE